MMNAIISRDYTAATKKTIEADIHDIITKTMKVWQELVLSNSDLDKDTALPMLYDFPNNPNDGSGQFEIRTAGSSKYINFFFGQFGIYDRGGLRKSRNTPYKKRLVSKNSMISDKMTVRRYNGSIEENAGKRANGLLPENTQLPASVGSRYNISMSNRIIGNLGMHQLKRNSRKAKNLLNEGEREKFAQKILKLHETEESGLEALATAVKKIDNSQSKLLGVKRATEYARIAAVDPKIDNSTNERLATLRAAYGEADGEAAARAAVAATKDVRNLRARAAAANVASRAHENSPFPPEDYSIHRAQEAALIARHLTNEVKLAEDRAAKIQANANFLRSAEEAERARRQRGITEVAAAAAQGRGSLQHTAQGDNENFSTVASGVMTVNEPPHDPEATAFFAELDDENAKRKGGYRQTRNRSRNRNRNRKTRKNKHQKQKQRSRR